MKRYTYDAIAATNPCWLRYGRAEELRRRVGTGVSARQVAASDISYTDKVWLLTSLLGRASLRALVEWAAGCAQDVRDAVDQEWRDDVDVAVQTAVAHVNGAASDAELSAAWSAADAAGSAAEEKQLADLVAYLEAEDR